MYLLGIEPLGELNDFFFVDVLAPVVTNEARTIVLEVPFMHGNRETITITQHMTRLTSRFRHAHWISAAGALNRSSQRHISAELLLNGRRFNDEWSNSSR